jgi:hypothetical protein
MYDTVNFWIDKGDTAEGSPFAVLPYLDEVTEQRSDKRGYSCSGKFGDYSVCCFQGGISLKGSLAKLYLPSNVYTLTRQTAKEALEQMGDGLHLDMGAAKVTRIDVSTVIPTKRPPTDYYRGLGNKPHFRRLQAHQDTLYYSQQFRQLIFYDKTKEAGAKGALIPPTLKGCNLMRYEMRLIKNTQRLLKSPTPITGATLTDSGFYYSIIQRWKSEFDTIKKINTISTMTDNIKTPQQAKEALFAILLQQAQQGGQSCIDAFLADLKAKDTFSDPKYYSRLKADLYRILQAPAEGESDMIKELEKAVADFAKYAR